MHTAPGKDENLSEAVSVNPRIDLSVVQSGAPTLDSGLVKTSKSPKSQP